MVSSDSKTVQLGVKTMPNAYRIYLAEWMNVMLFWVDMGRIMKSMTRYKVKNT